jgi:hypothetical protein
MGWSAIANIGGSILGGLGGALGGRSAARRQQQAANEANRLLAGADQENYADLSLYRDLGTGATRQLAERLGSNGDLARRFTLADYQEDPGYQFRLNQGEQAINRNALARGRFNSGSVLKELQGYNSNLASQEFGNAFNRWRAESGDIYGRLADASGRGQRAVESGNASRASLRGQMAQNIIGAGNAQAAGRISGANALIGGLNNIADWTTGQNALRQIRTPGYFPGP